MRKGQRTGWRRKTGRQPNHSYLWRERSKGYSAAVVSTQFIFELFAHTSLKKNGETTAGQYRCPTKASTEGAARRIRRQTIRYSRGLDNSVNIIQTRDRQCTVQHACDTAARTTRTRGVCVGGVCACAVRTMMTGLTEHTEDAGLR